MRIFWLFWFNAELNYTWNILTLEISSFNLVLSSSFKGFECIKYQIFDRREKSIPCWQRTITIFTFEKSFSVNGKYDINLLWKFKGKRKIIGQNLFLPKNHISTARLGKSLNHLMDMRLSRLIESSLNKISLKSKDHITNLLI